jgi:hypothetical protein
LAVKRLAPRSTPCATLWWLEKGKPLPAATSTPHHPKLVFFNTTMTQTDSYYLSKEPFFAAPAMKACLLPKTQG